MGAEPIDPHVGAIDADQRMEDLLPEKLCMWLSEIALVVMVALTAAEVVTRSLFHSSLEVTDELGGYMLAALTFLSLPVALTGNSYHRVEFIQQRLSRRGRAATRCFFNVLNLAFVGVLDWQLIRLVSRAFVQGDQASTVLATPLWIPQSAMIIGTTTLAFTLVRVIILDWHNAMRPDAAN